MFNAWATGFCYWRWIKEDAMVRSLALYNSYHAWTHKRVSKIVVVLRCSSWVFNETISSHWMTLFDWVRYTARFWQGSFGVITDLGKLWLDFLWRWLLIILTQTGSYLLDRHNWLKRHTFHTEFMISFKLLLACNQEGRRTPWVLHCIVKLRISPSVWHRTLFV